MCKLISRPQSGFTLIELMITVAVIGILGAIAYPSYNEYIAKSRRAVARNTLLEAAQWMERFYSQNSRYDQNSAGTATSAATVIGTQFTFVPKDATATSAHYQIVLTVINSNQNVYTLTAAPLNAMTGDKCGSYRTNQTGARINTGFTSVFADAIAAARECWR